MSRYQRALKLIGIIVNAENELRSILLGAAGNRPVSSVLTEEISAPSGKRTMSAAGRARIAAEQRARWAKTKGAAEQPTARKKKRTMSREARAKIAAAQKKR